MICITRCSHSYNNYRRFNNKLYKPIIECNIAIKSIGCCLFCVQVPRGAWHSIEVREASTIFEAKDGDYVAGK